MSYFLVKKLCTIEFSNNDVIFTAITSRFVDLQNENKRPTNGRFPPLTYQNWQIYCKNLDFLEIGIVACYFNVEIGLLVKNTKRYLQNLFFSCYLLTFDLMSPDKICKLR